MLGVPVQKKTLRKKLLVSQREIIQKVNKMAKDKQVWDTPNPKSKSKKLAPKAKASAKAMAKAAGRPYPNLIDNMRATKKKK